MNDVLQSVHYVTKLALENSLLKFLKPTSLDTLESPQPNSRKAVPAPLPKLQMRQAFLPSSLLASA